MWVSKLSWLATTGICNIHSNAPRLVEGRHLRNVGLLACLAGIDVDERLTGSIKHLEAARYLLDRPGSLRRGL